MVIILGFRITHRDILEYKEIITIRIYSSNDPYI